MSRRLLSAMLLLSAGPCLAGDMQTLRMDHVAVEFAGAPQAYVRAIAETAGLARTAGIEKFRFDLPETIRIRIVQSPGERARLYTDGRDHIFLTIGSEKDLRKPVDSGIYNIYGICHEIGHLAMYRSVPRHEWLTPAGAEGWAHYIGSRLVDEVFARKGEALWPDTYRYLDDGMKRFRMQQQSRTASPTVRGGALWEELFTNLGDGAVNAVLQAWGKARVDPTDPASVLRKAIPEDKASPAMADWWKRAESLLIQKTPQSNFAARTADRRDLSGQPAELKHDDGAAAGRLSSAGSGHAVRFTQAGSGWYLTEVRVHGARYGTPAPPREDFSVWLCDKDFKVVAEFPQPYSRFRRGPEDWVSLPVRPTEVPQEFIVCVGFNPTATKGVYVSYDGKASGGSLAGLPGRDPRPFPRGDWLIRVGLDRLAADDALHGIK